MTTRREDEGMGCGIDETNAQTTEAPPPLLKALRYEDLIIAATFAMPARARLAINEGNDSRVYNPDAQLHVKLDEKRVGRDLKRYIILGKLHGQGPMLLNFLDEVIIPLVNAGYVNHGWALDVRSFMSGLGAVVFRDDRERFAAWCMLLEDVIKVRP